MAGSPFLNACLYVGDLAPDVTEALLMETFQKVGPVLSVRVCRNAYTRQSLCYGYVNFSAHNDAERALQSLNHQVIHGKPMRLMWCQKDPSQRKGGRGNLIIKNLASTIDTSALHDTFSQFGNILSCKVETDSKGASRGYGFVHFESEEDAKMATAKVSGMLLEGQQVKVESFIPRAERIAHNRAEFTNVEVKGLKPGVTEEELKAHFEQFGPIKAVKVLSGKASFPLAFVDFESHEAAEKAIAESHGKPITSLCGTAEERA
eukprot:RCo053872